MAARELFKDDLFVVQLQDQNDTVYEEVVSVKFETLKKATVHKALPGTDSLSNDVGDDLAGIMYPGNGFYYDESSGRLDVKVESDLTFIDCILKDDSIPTQDQGLSVTVWDTTPGVTRRGNFYVVGSPHTVLNTDVWQVGTGQDSPALGDLVVCIDDSVSSQTGYLTHEWNVIPNVTGGQAVLQITSAIRHPSQLTGDPIQVSMTSGATSQRPRILAREAGQDSPGGTWMGGLITADDAEKLGLTPTDIITKEGFVTDVVIDNTTPSQEALHASYQSTSLSNRPEDSIYGYVTLSVKPASDSIPGVLELADQAEIFSVIDSTVTPIPSASKTAMTPQRTIDNFVPRLFGTLQSIESINT